MKESEANSNSFWKDCMLFQGKGIFYKSIGIITWFNIIMIIANITRAIILLI